jgi:hypothetical protein
MDLRLEATLQRLQITIAPQPIIVRRARVSAAEYEPARASYTAIRICAILARTDGQFARKNIPDRLGGLGNWPECHPSPMHASPLVTTSHRSLSRESLPNFGLPHPSKILHNSNEDVGEFETAPALTAEEHRL